MTSKQALQKIKDNFGCDLSYYGLNNEFEIIEKDLEVLEKLKTKTHLLYKDRKAIAKEFDKWCEDNNALNCSENMSTWFLTIKLKEWLKNDKININEF